MGMMFRYPTIPRVKQVEQSWQSLRECEMMQWIDSGTVCESEPCRLTTCTKRTALLCQSLLDLLSPRSTAPGGHKPWTHPTDCVCLPPLLDESIRLTPTKTCREVSSQSERRILQASLSPSSSPGLATKNSNMVEWTVTPSPCSVSLGYGADAFFPLQRFANASLRIRPKLCRMSSFLLFFAHFSLFQSVSSSLSPSFASFLNVAAGGREIIQTQCILQALWSVL